MVTEEHRDFARAVVALAREHKMSSLQMTFRCSYTFSSGPWEQIRMQWSEGRHGVESQIELRTESIDRISEKEQNP